MKHLNRIRLLLLAAAILGVYGCGTSSTGNTQEKVILTARQKSILAERNLPTEYEALDDSQQDAIVAIERMLQYAEAKYKIPMKYAGYVPYTPGVEWEHLYAYPESGREEIDCFEVTKRNDRYDDNYVEVRSSMKYADYVKSLILEDHLETAIKVYAKVRSTSLSAIPESGSAFEGTTGATLWIFVDSGSFSKDAFMKFVEKSRDQLEQHRLYTFSKFSLVKAGAMQTITRFNFNDRTSSEYCLENEDVLIHNPI